MTAVPPQDQQPPYPPQPGPQQQPAEQYPHTTSVPHPAQYPYDPSAQPAEQHPHTTSVPHASQYLYAPQPEYAQPAPYAGHPGYAPAPRFNVFAIVALAGAFAMPVVGIVFGHLALRQLRTSGEQGRGLAIAGLWVGYAYVALGAVFFVVWLTMLLAIVSGAVLSSPYS
jgi:hypothetical protein